MSSSVSTVAVLGVCNRVFEPCRTFVYLNIEVFHLLDAEMVAMKELNQGPKTVTKAKRPVEQLDLSETKLEPDDPRLKSLQITLLELRVTGCCLTALPPCLPQLQSLKCIYAGANLITDLGPLTQLRGLQHIGLCLNPIRRLPTPAEMQQLTGLISLDLSYCCLEDLGGALAALAALPALQYLNLAGNPFCLLPSYTSTVRSGWRKLTYLDGQRLDSNSSSRPATAQTRAPTPLTPEPWAGAGELAAEARLELALTGLTVLEDPFAHIKATWAAELAAAQAAGTSPVFSSLTSPLQPVWYHYELEGCDGHMDGIAAAQLDQTLPHCTTSSLHAALAAQAQPSQQAEQVPDQQEPAEDTLPGGLIPAVQPDPVATARRLAAGLAGAATTYCSIPWRLPAPTPPQGEAADVAGDKKGAKKDDRKAKTPEKGPGKPGSKPSTPLATAPAAVNLGRGDLCAVMPLPANVLARDWLQRGIQVRLYRSCVTAVPKPGVAPAPAASPVAPPSPAKGSKTQPAGKGKAKPEEVASAGLPDMSAYNIQVDTQLMGEGRVPAAALISGAFSHVSDVDLLPVARLWDAQGLRMALKDQRHGSQPVARLTASLVLRGGA